MSMRAAMTHEHWLPNTRYADWVACATEPDSSWAHWDWLKQPPWSTVL